jgi:adenylylsulfate kinase-like enzyme
MIVWLNGTFGAGKTTTAPEVVTRLPEARIFDPEHVGFLLRQVLPEPPGDFQHTRGRGRRAQGSASPLQSQAQLSPRTATASISTFIPGPSRQNTVVRAG